LIINLVLKLKPVHILDNKFGAKSKRYTYLKIKFVLKLKPVQLLDN